MVDLVRMTEGEFESYNHPLIEDYASDLARNFKKPIEKMQDIVKNQLGSLLRDGVDTKITFCSTFWMTPKRSAHCGSR